LEISEDMRIRGLRWSLEAFSEARGVGGFIQRMSYVVGLAREFSMLVEE
jgi:hypothetical protein